MVPGPRISLKLPKMQKRIFYTPLGGASKKLKLPKIDPIPMKIDEIECDRKLSIRRTSGDPSRPSPGPKEGVYKDFKKFLKNYGWGGVGSVTLRST